MVLVALALSVAAGPRVAGAMAGSNGDQAEMLTSDRTDQIQFDAIKVRVFVTVDGRRGQSFETVEDARTHAAELKLQSPEKRIRVKSYLIEQAELVSPPTPTTPAPTTSVTVAPPTSSPTTRPTTTDAPPTTPAPTTGVPTTTVPTTGTPTTRPPVTVAPTTAPPTTSRPTMTSTTSAPPTTRPSDFPFVTGQDATAPLSGRTKPAVGRTLADPAYRLDVTRLTSAAGTRFDRNTYSRRQAENADGTLFFTYHGAAQYRVYQVADGSPVATTSLDPDAEPQWHPTDPYKLRHLTGSNSYSGSLTLRETDVRTGRETTLADLTARVRAELPGARYLSDGAEGSPSADGNRYVWMVYNGSEQLIGVVSYDLASDRILGVLADVPTGFGKLDAISVSPSGRFIVAQWWDITYQYNIDFTGRRAIFPGGEHSDIAIGANGNDTYVYVDFTGSDRAGWVVAYDMVTGRYRNLIDLYDRANTSIHISGKAYDRPGWVVLSTYNCKVDGAWTCNKVMAVELATGKVLNLAHTYNCGDNYWTETHAVANRDLSRIYFNSDFGSCGIDAEVYRIDVPTLP